MSDMAEIHPLPTVREFAAMQAGHPSVGGPDGLGQEVTVYLADEEVDVLMRTVGIHHNQPTYQVDGDALGYAVHTALRLGMKEMDAVARTAITSAFNRAAIRPIRSEF